MIAITILVIIIAAAFICVLAEGQEVVCSQYFPVALAPVTEGPWLHSGKVASSYVGLLST